MANASFFSRTDMTALPTIYGEVVQANANRLVITDGFSRGVYIGNFGLDYFGTIYGTVSAYRSFFNESLKVNVQNINRDAYVFFSILERGDVQSALAFVFSGTI
jgi:hypothetical protein